MRLDTSSATHAAVVTPSDSTTLGSNCRGFTLGTAGDVKVTTLDGDAVVFTALAAGFIHPIACKRIWSTGTTATGIVAVW